MPTLEPSLAAELERIATDSGVDAGHPTPGNLLDQPAVDRLMKLWDAWPTAARYTLAELACNLGVGHPNERRCLWVIWSKVPGQIDDDGHTRQAWTVNTKKSSDYLKKAPKRAISQCAFDGA